MAEKNIGECVDNTQEKQDVPIEESDKSDETKDNNQEETMSTESNRCHTLKN